jgi:hypothetical protein
MVPERFAAYECADYFGGGWAECGHFDEPSQTLVVAPLAEAYEDVDIGFFAVGRSGWGGIDFGYRRGHPGLWAYRPIGREWQFMAASVSELVEGGGSGRLSVCRLTSRCT